MTHCKSCGEVIDGFDPGLCEECRLALDAAIVKLAKAMEEPIEHPSFTRAKALPEPWRSHFPKSIEEARAFQPILMRRVLARTVMIVAKTRVECAWAAYAGGVPGQNHDEEEEDVFRQGSKLIEETARFFFPEFEGIPYAR